MSVSQRSKNAHSNSSALPPPLSVPSPSHRTATATPAAVAGVVVAVEEDVVVVAAVVGEVAAGEAAVEVEEAATATRRRQQQRPQETASAMARTASRQATNANGLSNRTAARTLACVGRASPSYSPWRKR